MDNVAQKIYFGMDVSDKFVEIFALPPDSAQNQRMKIENNRKSLSYFCQNIPDKKAVAVAMENGRLGHGELSCRPYLPLTLCGIHRHEI